MKKLDLSEFLPDGFGMLRDVAQDVVTFTPVRQAPYDQAARKDWYRELANADLRNRKKLGSLLWAASEMHKHSDHAEAAHVGFKIAEALKRFRHHGDVPQHPIDRRNSVEAWSTPRG